MKKVFVYLTLLALAGMLGLVNYYLLQLQTNKQEHIANLQAQVQRHLRENKFLNDRNEALRIEVDNLRSPDSYFSYEEKAREDYGLIGANETFFVLPKQDIDNIPNIEGLLASKAVTLNDFTGMANDEDLEGIPAIPTGRTGEGSLLPIPVNPVPLKLESLQPE